MKKFLFLYIFLIITAIPFVNYNFSSSKEKEFISLGLIRGGAIYTLLGDKPVTTFLYIPYSSWHLETLLQEFENFVWEKLGWVQPENVTNDLSIYYWKFWKRKNKINGEKFCLVQEVNNHGISVSLVNKLAVRQILEGYYDIIVNCITYDFDIEQVLAEIEDPKSIFWTQIMNCRSGHICLGLLYGYGLENAQKYQSFIENKKKGEEARYQPFYRKSRKEFLNLTNCHNGSLDYLPLPIYRLFSDNDPILEHYKQERARIQQEYKDVDLRKLFIEAFY